MSEDRIVLKVENLRKWFTIRRGFFGAAAQVKALDGVTFELGTGEAVSVVGESGSGKTTLGKTVLRLYEPTDGKLIFKGKDITHTPEKDLMWFKRETGLVQQDPYGAMPSFMTIYRILEEPLIIHKVGTKEERAEMVFKALEEVRLTPVEDFAFKYPHMLSGGQLQRVAIARALILRPSLVVADEPVSMLDASVRVEILTLMREMQEKRNISFIYITHDLSTTRYFSEWIFIMYAGQIIERAPTKTLLQNPLHPYTRALLSAIPDPDPENRKKFREVPPGEPPSLVNPPPGCRFAPRCPFASNKCRTEEPPEVEVEPKHFVKCWLYAGAKA
ncbi:MAG: ABC transporter ATP-binding protein [Thermofilum sp.]|jgi:peptide/nickel transport system ATP-binding protein|uniref:ABC transporter ATP-binding protein n=1 Tax=Thermofilum sp. TaxID=1961369 RepID=UPI00258C772B|nr:ABC transporter ATP-binding protein [Thermofilum sp.]MCI4407960.1 ABC transporter ATP-binding protein [Thermofilum sp.]